MKLSLGQEFKHIILALNEMLEGNIILQCKKSGLYCKMADDASVCLIEIFLNKDQIIEYDVTEGEIIGIDMKLLHKIMKTIKYDTLHLTKNKETLNIVSEGSRKCEFKLPLVDTLYDEIDIPEINYDCIFTMDKNSFQGVCKDLKQFGEEVVLKVADKIVFSTKDEIECKVEIETEIENENNIIIEKRYDLKYFLKMLKANQLSEEISFYQSFDMPLVVEYKISEESYIRYYLGNMI